MCAVADRSICFKFNRRVPRAINRPEPYFCHIRHNETVTSANVLDEQLYTCCACKPEVWLRVCSRRDYAPNHRNALDRKCNVDISCSSIRRRLPRSARARLTGEALALARRHNSPAVSNSPYQVRAYCKRIHQIAT